MGGRGRGRLGAVGLGLEGDEDGGEREGVGDVPASGAHAGGDAGEYEREPEVLGEAVVRRERDGFVSGLRGGAGRGEQ